MRITSLSSPFVISSPNLGIFNLLGEKGDALVAEDRAGLAALFNGFVESTGTNPPVCDVLLLYCLITPEGRINGTTDSLKEIILKSQASIVIIASPNSPEAYTAMYVGSPAEVGINLVTVLDRRGPRFVDFYKKLFSLMQQEKTMPCAWVELAPQYEDAKEHADCPSQVLRCYAGHIVFAKSNDNPQ
jgi:hypothetical protein